MKKNKLFIVVIIIFFLAMIVSAVIFFNSRKHVQIADKSEIEEVQDTNATMKENENNSNPDTGAKQDGSDPVSGERNSGKQETDENASVSSSDNAGETDAGQTGGKDDEEHENVVAFPYKIKGTSLVVKSVSSYDGIYLEDGSDGEIEGVAALLIQNTGKTDVEYADITINRSDQSWTFEVSDLPAGELAVVQEKNKALYQEGTYIGCSAVAAEQEGLEMSEDEIKVEETDDGSLKITNLTDREIPCVRIFYKFYMEEENTYVGGITYTSKLNGLPAGGSRVVRPSHYSAGNSRIVMIRTYDATQ